MKFPGQGRSILFLSKLISQRKKNKFKEKINNDLDYLKLDRFKTSEFELISFCGAGGFMDLMKCILSYLTNIGIPRKWYVYSDGEINETHQEMIKGFPFVEFRLWDHFYIGQFGNINVPWMLKKYTVFGLHRYTLPSIFCDSDVLFYDKAKLYLDKLKGFNYVLPEPPGADSIDAELIEKNLNGIYNFNSGFFVINNQPDFEDGFTYLKQAAAKGDINYFAEQSAFNLIISKQPHLFQPLDPRIFIVTLEDQFHFAHSCDYGKIAMRHFVGPVRHKMWM